MTLTLSIEFENHDYEVEVQPEATVNELACKLTEISRLDPENEIILVDHVPVPLQLWRSLTYYSLSFTSRILLLGEQTAIAEPRESLSAFQLERVRRETQKSNPVGMNNDGNLCYLASAIQYMLCVTPFSAAIAEQREGTPLFESICRVFKQMSLKESAHPTHNLGDALSSRFAIFVRGEEQDSEEALDSLLGVICEDISNQITHITAEEGAISQSVAQPSEPESYGSELIIFAKQHGPSALFDYKLSDGSKERFLRIPASGVDTVEDAISKELGTRRFLELPPMLELHVMRFTSSAENPLKLTRKVAFAPEMSLMEYCDPDCIVMGLDGTQNQAIYHLKAVIAHKGLTIEEGHYVCYAKHGKQWFLFDDAVVEAVDEITVLGCAGSSGLGYTSYVILYCLEHMMQ